MENPKISIIVPVYKVEKYLPQCLDSIVNQTYRNLEIILVDDGSPDNSGAICDAYAAADSRVRVIHQENAGVSCARNAGLDAATGDYLLFVDSDDHISADAVMDMYSTLIAEDADLVIYNFERFGEDFQEVRPSPIRDEKLTQAQFVEKLSREHGWYYCVLWNKLYKKEAFHGLRFPEDYIHEDDALMHRVVGRCGKIVTVGKVTYFYRQLLSSIMGEPVSPKNMDRLAALADRIRYTADQGWHKLHENAVEAFVYYCLDYAARFPKTQENQKYFKRMDDSLRVSSPYIKKSKAVTWKQKLRLQLIRINPMLYRWLMKITGVSG